MDYGWLSSYPNGVSNPAIAQDLTKVTASGAAALDPPKRNPLATSGRGGDGRGGVKTPRERGTRWRERKSEGSGDRHRRHPILPELKMTSPGWSDGNDERIERNVMRRAVTGHVTRKGLTKAEERGSARDFRRPY